MRSLQVTGPNEFKIIELPVPTCGADEVLIQMRACTICNQHDMAVFAGRPHGGARSYPLEPGFPGHEGAGVVVEVGEDVTDLAAGDRVVTTGIGGPPLYSQFVTRRQGTAVKFNDAIDFVHAAPLELFGCVHHAFELTSGVKGSRVGVVGLGPGGQAAVALARAFGAAEIVAFDLEAARRDRALQMGATSTVDAAPLAGAYGIARRLVCERAAPSAAEQAVLDAVNANQCEILFECSGHPRSMENSFLLAGREMTVFGYVPQPVEVVPAMWFAKELVIRNSKILSIDDLRAVTRLLEQGRIDTRPVVTHVMPFAQYDKALGLVSRREAIKVALVWE